MITPSIVSYIHEKTAPDEASETKENGFGYKYVSLYFIGINVIGFILNSYLYYVDIKYYDGVLNRVDDGDAIEELMASPAPGQRAGDLIRASALKA